MNDILSRKLAPSPDVMESAVGDETIILHLANGVYYGLDGVGTRIWSSIQRGLSTTDICHQLSEEFNVDLATIEDDARLFLTELRKQGIVIDA